MDLKEMVDRNAKVFGFTEEQTAQVHALVNIAFIQGGIESTRRFCDEIADTVSK